MYVRADGYNLPDAFALSRVYYLCYLEGGQIVASTDEQYMAYLRAEVARKEALYAELTKPPQPVVGLFRVKSNGAGNFIWTGRKWQAT